MPILSQSRDTSAIGCFFAPFEHRHVNCAFAYALKSYRPEAYADCFMAAKRCGGRNGLASSSQPGNDAIDDRSNSCSKNRWAGAG